MQKPSLNYEQWIKQYKPITNKAALRRWPVENVLAFETHGDDLKKILASEYNHIWTETEYEGKFYIMAGYHLVNRMRHFITKEPWTDKNLEVQHNG